MSTLSSNKSTTEVIETPIEPPDPQTADRYRMSFGFINTNQITLESFSGDVAPVNFINEMTSFSEDIPSDSFIHTDNSDTKCIDPVPYISSLKMVQEKLATLMDECDKKKLECEKEAELKETKYHKSVMRHSKTTSSLKGNYNDLYMSVEKLNSSKIEPLSEKLKKVTTLNDNASEIIFLLKSYNHFYKHNEVPLEIMTSKKGSNTIETATTISQLLKLSSQLSQDSSLANGSKTHKLIEEVAHKFEKDQLNSFNTLYSSQNFMRLQTISNTLFAFNDGINIIDNLIENQSIFSSLQSKVNKSVDASYWVALSDPKNSSYELDGDSFELLNSLRVTINDELDSLVTIFQHNSKKALSLLMIKLAEKMLKPRLDSLLDVAKSKSKLAFLRTLHLFSNGVSQQLFLPLRTAFYESVTKLSIDTENIHYILFHRYLDENSYFKMEKENLQAYIDLLIQPFEVANRDSLRDKKLTTKIENMKLEGEYSEDEHLSNLEDYEANPYKDSASIDAPEISVNKEGTQQNIYLPDSRVLRDKSKGARKYIPSSQRLKKIAGSGFIKLNEKYSIFDRYKSPVQSDSIDPSFKESVPESNVTDSTKSVLSLQVSQNIYRLTLESLTRSIELVPTQSNFYTIELFNLLIYKIGPSYIALGLESLYGNFVDSQIKNKGVFSRGSNNTVDISFLQQLYNVLIQLYLLSTVIKKSFYPLVSTEDDSSHMCDSFNNFLQDVEIGINIIMNDTVEIIKERITSILCKQPTNDYSVVSEAERTQTSELMAMLLENILRGAMTELRFDSRLKLSFITKVSNFFLSSLIIHLSHMKVTMNGFTVLTHDLAHYILIFNNLSVENTEENMYETYGSSPRETEYTVKWERDQIENIQTAFKILNEIPGLYSCDPESLKDFCNEGKLNDLKPEIINSFISNREDFQSRFLSNS